MQNLESTTREEVFLVILTVVPPLFVRITFLFTMDLWSQISKVQRVERHLGFDPRNGHWIITETSYRNWPPAASGVTCQRYGAGFLAQGKRYGQLPVSCILFSKSESGETDVFDFRVQLLGIGREVWV